MRDQLPPAPPGSHWWDLTNHVSVVTGGNSGIGIGIATGLLDAGATVCIWGRNAAKNDAAVEQLSGLGGKVFSTVCDVADEAAVVEAMSAVVADHGHLNSCFANAGVGAGHTPALRTTLDEFRSITSVNLDGTFVTMREAARHMVDGGNGGSLVVTSSMAVRFGMARGHGYAASKSGMVSLAQAFAVEFGRHGIRANALLPGWTHSGLTDDALADESFAAAVKPRIPARRWGTPADFAAIAVYLASPASQWHTGDSILIDGGYSAF